MSPSPDRCTAVVPIRSWTTGKSRLDLAGADREAVSRAFARDVVDVLLISPDIDEVVVVTSDDDVRASLDGCSFVDDPGSGLNDAVAAGANGFTRVVVVPSDLPCLTVEALAEVLRLAADHTHASCSDAEGDGTTLVVSQDPPTLVTSYGPGSAAAHRAAGVVPLTGVPAEARRDVDTVAHLREAEALGVGPRTAAAVAEIRAAVPPRP